MFVSLTRLRRNPKLYFFNDKGSLASSAATKVPLPVLDCVSRTDGATPHTNIFLMLTEKNFVSGNAVCVTVTPAQNELLQLISENAQDLALYLKDAQERATYLCEFEPTKDQLRGDYHLLSLIEAIHNVATEKLTVN